VANGAINAKHLALKRRGALKTGLGSQYIAPTRKKMSPLKSIAGVVMAVTTSAHAIEQPKFTVLKTADVFEIRRYEPYVVAEVLVTGPATDAGSQAFPILAGYIFGKNKGERNFDMTAPVTQTAVSAPLKLEMTAPVTQTPAAEGFLVQFMMPAAYTLATLPEPLDARVKLREVSEQTVAVIKYSGTWSQSNYDEHLGILKKALSQASIATQGEPVYSRYNAPFTPWFLRTNEIWFKVR
jgi:hypothetical protein